MGFKGRMSVKVSPNRRKEEGKEKKKKKINHPKPIPPAQGETPTASTLPLPDYMHIFRHFEF